MLATLSDLLAAGVSLFSQGSRLLKLRFGEGSGIPEDSLLPHQIHGEEGLLSTVNNFDGIYPVSDQAA